MTAPPPPIPADVAPSTEKTLHRLFLLLFLRGRTSRGLKKQNAPSSIGQKLGLVLGMYLLLGLMALLFYGRPVFALSVYLHATTFSFLGIFLASSAGEVLFNKEEADILLHRPIEPRTLLWTKIRVLLEASLWLAGAFNLVGFFAGFGAADGSWLFLPAHLVSVALEALFCAGSVVMCYQLCLRWFGRERLEGLITTAQVIVAVAAVLAGQILPRMVFQMERLVSVNTHSWWIMLLPPAWFAGFDDAVAGERAATSWMLAGMALAVTVLVWWFAFAKLAHDYDTGLQMLSETVSKKPRTREGRRWINVLVEQPPLRWWLRDPVARASFVLTSAYLLRDRDVKLRVYPAIAPILALPIVMLVRVHGEHDSPADGFMVTFVGSYLGMVPMMALNLLQFSQQWQAADIFRAAPMQGPARLCHGARRAVLCILALPLVLLFAAIAWGVQRDVSQLVLLLPGVVAMPVYALAAGYIGYGVPLSRPTEEAKGASRGLTMIGITLSSFVVSGIAAVSWSGGFFYWFLLGEVILASALYTALRISFPIQRWSSIE